MSITIPETGFLRLSSIIGAPRADPPIPAIIPVSRSTWWAGVKSGRYPKPVKLGLRITAWRVEDILALIRENHGSADGPDKNPAQHSRSPQDQDE